MKRLYMEEQQEFFPHLDHWSQVFWAVVNEIVDNQDEDGLWNQLKAVSPSDNPLPEVDLDVLL